MSAVSIACAAVPDRTGESATITLVACRAPIGDELHELATTIALDTRETVAVPFLPTLDSEPRS